ncbi:sulfur carrier protein ThiS [Acetobacteraceae bacterium KSS8]|uniref:Sulfur carrier protein ThiS n=1 Tax=Endosaccharibacter trunci TaxID=2812733 RepID=A0ABT1W7V8_9PROT|nr:sulfur carrier protein ThiS [Acetobacteraceae bacterium KSS8]
MKIMVNGEPREVASATVAEVLVELGYGEARVATALDGDFVPARTRGAAALAPGSALEIVAPMQGG